MFTMEEYIEKHELGVSHRDPQATRLIANHLRSQGYVARTVQVEGKRRRRWMKKDEIGALNYEALKEKLNGLLGDTPE